MKWVKWSINRGSDPPQTLEEVCKSKFKSLKITDQDYYKDDICSFMSIETCKYKYDVSNISNDDICIFGDIEIFNWSELCDKYELQFNEEFLLLLYEKCGAKIFSELNGEFSFILFDKRKNKVFLVIDPLGIKEIFWCFSNNVLNASTDLFLLEEIIDQQQWNKQYFRDFLQLNGIYTGNETPYANVFRVLPGHYVSINLDSSKIETNKYWDLSDVKAITRYKTEDEYFEQFRILMTQALERRLLPEKNGVAMSGGLDSTTLFAISKSILEIDDIQPVSGVFAQLQDCDETSLIQEVCGMYNTEPGLVNCDDCGMLVNYPERYPISNEPHCPSLSSSFTLKILEYAFQNNIVNLIDGYAADYLLAGTPLTSVDLMKRGRIFYLFKYLKDVSHMYDESIYLSIIKNLIKRESVEVDDIMLAHLKSNMSKIKTQNQRHIYTQIFYARTFKLLDRDMAPIFNISMRHPFLDKDLVEFIYTIPGEMLFQKTKDKYLIREGMKQYLPTGIINKTQKTQHVSLSFKGINEVWSKVYSVVEQYRQEHLCESDVNKEEWLTMLQDFRAGKEFSNEIFSMLCLELWLAENSGK
ncbi:MAG: asparagine synthase-related protein [Defluviitaleaceae bacterium]|nr:asparagine synthase-related protein [Defluviitaleaceae bacterium]